jgi:hypothetical protein
MNKFDTLKDRLQEHGWYLGWALPCCQSCAWMELPMEHKDGPFKGQEVDYDKVLFNHEQDCLLDCEYDEENEKYILPEGMTRDDYSVFPHTTPEQQTNSLFCFSGEEVGIENLKKILPVIEAAGCRYDWSGSPNSRIEIDWS